MSQPVYCSQCCDAAHGGVRLCPLHAAAEKLLASLEALVKMYPHASATYAPWTEAVAAIASAKTVSWVHGTAPVEIRYEPSEQKPWGVYVGGKLLGRDYSEQAAMIRSASR